MNINKPQYARLLFIDKKIRSGTRPNASAIAAEYEVALNTSSQINTLSTNKN